MSVHTSYWRLAVGLATCLIGAACGEVTVRNDEPSPPHVPIADLRSAPSFVEVGGSRVTLDDVYLWRDFMPGSEPGGSLLRVSLHVIEADSAEFPASVEPRFVWVVRDSEVWSALFSDEQRPPQPPYREERVARGGPKWGPDVDVDVIVGLVEASEQLSLVAARGQRIQRTD